MRKPLFFYWAAVLGLCLLPLMGRGQTTLATWNFDTSTPVAATTTANVTAQDASFGSGLNTASYSQGKPTTGKAYSNSGWSTSSLDLTDYFEIGLSANSGYTVSLTGIQFDEQRSGTGPANFVVRYSTDNFATFTEAGSGTAAAAFATRTYNGFTLTDVTSVKVRIYGYTAGGAGGTWRFDNVSLSGTVTEIYTTAPKITAPGAVTLAATNAGRASAATAINVKGANLTDPISVVFSPATTQFELSTDNTTWAATATLPPAGGTLYVRTAAAAVEASPGTATLTYTSGSTTATTTLSGTVYPAGTGPCGSSTAIGTVRADIPAQGSYTGTTATITGTVTATFGANKFYVQDATGGIAVFSSNVVSNLGLSVGDVVTVTGTRSRFNGEAQLSPVSCSAKLGSAAAPAPVAYTGGSVNDFLAANEGRLVTFKQVSFTEAGTFQASTNYDFYVCGATTAEARIEPNSSLPGSSIPSTTQQLTGVVGHFISANSNILQLFPRSATDVTAAAEACPTAPPTCGVATFAGSEGLLDIVNWNVEWLGNTAFGPTNEAQQLANVRSVLNSMGADVYMLQEVCSYNPANPTDPTTSFGSLIEGLNASFPGRNYTGECSNRYSYSEVSNPDPMGQRVCFIYRSDQITRESTTPLLTDVVATNYPTGTNTQFWASGRFPFMMVATTNLGGQTARIHLINLHAKSGSAQEDYNRRIYDYGKLYEYLNANHAEDNVYIAGDFNDDMDASIYANQISSVKAFLYADPATTDINAARPSASWRSITKQFSDARCSSTAGYPDFIDHVIVSNEFQNTPSGARPLAHDGTYSYTSVVTVRPSVSTATTSDHYPTATTLSITAPLPVELLSFGAERQPDGGVQLNWTTASEKNNRLFEIQRSADARHFEGIGSQAGRGTTNARTAYRFTDQKPFAGLTYYRLRQVDADGGVNYSRTVSVAAAGQAATLTVSPNPASGFVAVSVAGGTVRALTLRTLQGQVLYTQQGAGRLSVAPLPAGTYLVEVLTGDGQRLHQRLVRQ